MEINIPLPGGFIIRHADWEDAIRIQRLLNKHALIHRYLDWREPIQWLGARPFLLLEERGRLQAVMACPSDPTGITWMRLFACSWEIPLKLAWQHLFTETSILLNGDLTQVRCFVLAIEDWIDSLLQSYQYRKVQEIIVLKRELNEQSLPAMSVETIIRPMRSDDIPIVATIDVSSFEDIWIYSPQTLELAFQQSNYAYIAEMEGIPVGYLISTQSKNTAHLARIAISPERKRHHIATHLISRLFFDLRNKGISLLTLNTQSNNRASLALYDKMGFRRTGESFGVYQIL